MKKFATAFSAVLFAALFALTASAQTASEYFMLGNNAYKAGNYAEAVDDYRCAMKLGLGGAPVEYNLANALAKTNKKGEALLNYKRAYANDPRMREASANLEMFAKDNSFDSGFGNFSTMLFPELSDSEWTTAAFIFFWLAVLLIFIPPLFSKKSVATIFMAIICSMFFVVAVLALRDWRSYMQAAVAIKSDVPLKVSPTPNAPVLAIVSEGQTAKIKMRKGTDYIYVETPTGKSGWASVAEFVPIAE